MNNVEMPTIELDYPIIRGTGDKQKEIKEFTLRRPMGGDLRGQSLIDISMAKVDALAVVLPRISNPVIHEHEVKNMDAADLMDVGLTIAGFFTKAKHQLQAEAETAAIPTA